MEDLKYSLEPIKTEDSKEVFKKLFTIDNDLFIFGDARSLNKVILDFLLFAQSEYLFNEGFEIECISKEGDIFNYKFKSLDSEKLVYKVSSNNNMLKTILYRGVKLHNDYAKMMNQVEEFRSMDKEKEETKEFKKNIDDLLLRIKAEVSEKYFNKEEIYVIRAKALD